MEAVDVELTLFIFAVISELVLEYSSEFGKQHVAFLVDGFHTASDANSIFALNFFDCELLNRNLISNDSRSLIFLFSSVAERALLDT